MPNHGFPRPWVWHEGWEGTRGRPREKGGKSEFEAELCARAATSNCAKHSIAATDSLDSFASDRLNCSVVKDESWRQIVSVRGLPPTCGSAGDAGRGRPAWPSAVQPPRRAGAPATSEAEKLPRALPSQIQQPNSHKPALFAGGSARRPARRRAPYALRQKGLPGACPMSRGTAYPPPHGLLLSSSTGPAAAASPFLVLFGLENELDQPAAPARAQARSNGSTAAGISATRQGARFPRSRDAARLVLRRISRCDR